MGVNEVVPLLNIKDMSKSIAFYIDGLGFKITAEWRVEGELRWCRLQLGGAGIMVQQVIPQIDRPPGSGVVLCLFCDDAVALYHQFTARGIDAAEPFVGNALWVTSVTDPDGYRLDFESPTDLPEETKLSEAV